MLYHFTMTIQSVWNREPRAAVTVTGVLDCEGKTRSQTYAHVLLEAQHAWHRRYPGITMGELVVLFFSLEREEL